MPQHEPFLASFQVSVELSVVLHHPSGGQSGLLASVLGNALMQLEI